MTSHSAPLIRSRLWRFINFLTYLLTYLLTYIVCNDLTLGLVQLQTNALADGLYCRYISAQIIYLSADGTVIKVPYIQF